jgi:alpha-glucosidase
MTDYKEAQQFDNRDPNRTPMQWNALEGAGFTNSSTPWLKINPNYVAKNVEKQLQSPSKTNLHVYKQLTKLRQQPTFALGTFYQMTIGSNIYAFVRELTGHPTFAVVLNLVEHEEITDLSVFVNLPEKMLVASSGVASTYEIGDLIEINIIHLTGYDALVLQERSAATALTFSVIFLIFAALLNLS